MEFLFFQILRVVKNIVCNFLLGGEGGGEIIGSKTGAVKINALLMPLTL